VTADPVLAVILPVSFLEKKPADSGAYIRSAVLAGWPTAAGVLGFWP
jgi:hypothetical protein